MLHNASSSSSHSSASLSASLAQVDASLVDRHRAMTPSVVSTPTAISTGPDRVCHGATPPSSSQPSSFSLDVDAVLPRKRARSRRGVDVNPPSNIVGEVGASHRGGCADVCRSAAARGCCGTHDCVHGVSFATAAGLRACSRRPRLPMVSMRVETACRREKNKIGNRQACEVGHATTAHLTPDIVSSQAL